MNIFQGPALVFWAQVELDKSNLTSCACRLDLTPSLRVSLQITWHVTACQVNLKGDPPKITCASCLKNPPTGPGAPGGGQVTVMAIKNDHFSFPPKKNRWKWCNWRASCMAANYQKRCSWNYFAKFSTMIGQTSTWQCCCGVVGFSATICKQYVRCDMPVTITVCSCLFIPMFSFSVVPVSKIFVPVWTVKKMWVTGYVTVIFHILSIQRHWF